MLLALPLTASDTFSPHYGAATKAGLFEVDPEHRTVLRAVAVFPPEPEPCGWADWLGAQGVTVILAGGMGRGAQQRMKAAGIEVIAGVPTTAPIKLVNAWLAGTLVAGTNTCEGGHHGEGHNHECAGHPHHHHPEDPPQ